MSYLYSSIRPTDGKSQIVEYLTYVGVCNFLGNNTKLVKTRQGPFMMLPCMYKQDIISADYYVKTKLKNLNNKHVY